MGVEQILGVTKAVAVTPSDSVDILKTRAILVKTAGDYKFTMADGGEVSVYLLAGVWHPLWVTRVWATGAASATGIVAGY